LLVQKDKLKNRDVKWTDSYDMAQKISISGENPDLKVSHNPFEISQEVTGIFV